MLCYNSALMAVERKFDMELFFSALADRTRLRLINLMRDREVCVCFFAKALGTNNPKISRHLAYLKRASLVIGRRDGKWMHYRIQKPSNEYAAGILSDTMKMLSEDKEMSIDRSRLVTVSCASNSPVEINGRARSQKAIVGV